MTSPLIDLKSALPNVGFFELQAFICSKQCVTLSRSEREGITSELLFFLSHMSETVGVSQVKNTKLNNPALSTGGASSLEDQIREVVMQRNLLFVTSYWN